jgi:hypothetical protein
MADKEGSAFSLAEYWKPLTSEWSRRARRSVRSRRCGARLIRHVSRDERRHCLPSVLLSHILEAAQRCEVRLGFATFVGDGEVESAGGVVRDEARDA